MPPDAAWVLHKYTLFCFLEEEFSMFALLSSKGIKIYIHCYGISSARVRLFSFSEVCTHMWHYNSGNNIWIINKKLIFELWIDCICSNYWEIVFTLMCHAIHMFRMTAPDTYSSDEFLPEELNISKEDRRWAPENLHSLWLIDLYNEGKASVRTCAIESQMQQLIKEMRHFLRQCNPSCSCRCYFSQH